MTFIHWEATVYNSAQSFTLGRDLSFVFLDQHTAVFRFLGIKGYLLEKSPLVEVIVDYDPSGGGRRSHVGGPGRCGT